MNRLLNDQRRLAHLRLALENLERWAAARAAKSHTDPSWRHLRTKGSAEAAAELQEQEGAESAYADAAARIAHVRRALAETDGQLALDRSLATLGALRGEVQWCETQRADALDAEEDAMGEEALHARGRVAALEELADAIRRAIEDAP